MLEVLDVEEKPKKIGPILKGNTETEILFVDAKATDLL